MQAELIAIATTDCLTGLLTRRAFVEVAERMLQRAYTGQPLSVLICDLDKFKAINDTYGHAIGDIVLQKVGREAGSIDVAAGRLGGEEIAFLIEGRLDDAVEHAECLRETVGELAIGAGNKTIRITCSIGAAEWEPGDTVDSLLRRADIALYEAKRSGRNRVIAADSFSVANEHEQWRGVARLASRRTK
jgi:two-component system, cell cycle response regulator